MPHEKGKQTNKTVRNELNYIMTWLAWASWPLFRRHSRWSLGEWLVQEWPGTRLRRTSLKSWTRPSRVSRAAWTIWSNKLRYQKKKNRNRDDLIHFSMFIVSEQWIVPKHFRSSETIRRKCQSSRAESDWESPGQQCSFFVRQKLVKIRFWNKVYIFFINKRVVLLYSRFI